MTPLRVAPIQPHQGHALLGRGKGNKAMLRFLAVGVHEKGLAPRAAGVPRDAGPNVVVVSGVAASGKPVDHHGSIREDSEPGKVGPVPPEVPSLMNGKGLLPGSSLFAVREAQTMTGARAEGLEPGHEEAAFRVGGDLRECGISAGRRIEGPEIRLDPRFGRSKKGRSQGRRKNQGRGREYAIHGPFSPDRTI